MSWPEGRHRIAQLQHAIATRFDPIIRSAERMAATDCYSSVADGPQSSSPVPGPSAGIREVGSSVPV